MQTCPKRTGFRWTTIYTKMRQRLDAFHKTKEELELDFSKPLDEQDPILKLNLLAKKKRKDANDLHDYFRSTKRLHQGPGQDDLARTFSSLLVAEALRRSNSIFTSVYVAVQKLKKALARALVQLGWQCQAE
ncbi:hypothetical protein Tco_0813403 [Tanacetum coccineum]